MHNTHRARGRPSALGPPLPANPACPLRPPAPATDNFSDAAADVVCKQMGWNFGQLLKAFGVGAVNQSIWLDSPVCKGNEPNLLACRLTNPVGTTDCTHQEDVGVRCSRSTPWRPASPPPPDCE